MGNTGTKTDLMSIYVQTDDPYCNPHGLVKGSVYIQTYQTVDSGGIDLVIKGTEKVKWEELKSGPQPAHDSKITEKIKEKNVIFNFAAKLLQAAGRLNPGQYQFPFSFQLPDQIPGTFSIKYGGCEGRVKYSLKATLISGIRQDLRYKTEFIVRQNPFMANNNATLNQEKAVCVCCLPKGRCRLECSFESDSYQPGQEAYVKCQADNRQCSLAIKNFNLSLIQRITFRTKLGKETAFTRNIAQTEEPGILAGEMTPQAKLMRLKLEDPSAKVVSEGKDSAGAVLQPSVQGNLLICRYEIAVRPIFDTACACCSDAPTVTLPLQIYAPQLMTWIQAPPTDFRPVAFTMEQILLPLPSISMSVGLPQVSVTMAGPPAPMVTSNVNMSMNVGGPNMTVQMNAPNAQISGNMGGVEMHVGDSHGASVHVDMPMIAPTLTVGTGYVESSSSVYGSGAHMQVRTEGTMGVTGNVEVHGNINL